MIFLNNSASDDDSDEAQSLDAIPIDCLWLTEAYDAVVDSIVDLVDFAPEALRVWQEELASSREIEKNAGHDPETFDAALELLWQRRKEANLFLRQALEDSALTACVRDPDTGETLQLAPTNWISASWSRNGYVPPGIWSNFIGADDTDCPGPTGSLLRGALRPVFFLKENFELWLTANLGDTVITDSSDASINSADASHKIHSQHNYRSRRGDLKVAIKHVALEIWGENGPPPGMLRKTRYEMIKTALQKKIKRMPAEKTIHRALKELAELPVTNT